LRRNGEEESNRAKEGAPKMRSSFKPLWLVLGSVRKETLNKPLPGNVVAGVLTLVAVLVCLLAWKLVLAPPAPAPLVAMTRQQIQQALQKNAQTVAQIRAEQMRLYAAAHPGWRPGVAQPQGGYRQMARQSKRGSGQRK
jgi:hypothetical protein